MGSISFVLDKARVGINQIAEYLALIGYEVIYISSPSSIFDLFSKPRRNRFCKAWPWQRYYQIKPGLIEVIPRSPWILNKVGSNFIGNLTYALNKNVLGQRFDIMIATVGALNLFSRRIIAPMKVLRLQDSPNDFGLSRFLCAEIEGNIKEGVYQQIWAVSHALCDYAKLLGQVEKTYYLPNGVRLESFLNRFMRNSVRKCIYVGTFDNWVDINLIICSAKLLPNWQFDLFGPKLVNSELPENVHYFGDIENDRLPILFNQYSVGLIPFKDCEHINVVERPLKFSQYLASGLGVASVSHGGLKTGLKGWASFGNTPKEFASAIEDAYLTRDLRTKIMVMEYLKNYEWSILLEQMRNLLLKE